MRLLLFCLPLCLFAQELPLYPGPAPGSENATWQEGFLPANDGKRRIFNVTRPTLTPYLAPNPNGTAIVVCPGGGFRHLAIDHEGHEVARFLNTLGVSAFVLKYRVYRSDDLTPSNTASHIEMRRAEGMRLGADDARAALALLRQRAAEFKIRADRIGILGFSAGGYHAAAAALVHTPANRPDFAIPIYPGVPADAQAPARPMPLFLLHADDDKTVPPRDTSVRLYNLWKQAGASAELHIYSRGGHGFGIRKINQPVDTWPDRLREWLGAQGLL
ncbi:MAG: alpha/beta hydrolase [Bryobacter sp.]|nr:alpha/beta hydrolase [Bryobacter sp.]